MNWDAIGAIGQMLGSVAVFVTLGYLAVQVRHAKDQIQRSLVEVRGRGIRELSAIRATGEWLNVVYEKASRNLGETPPGAIVTLMERAGLTYAEAYAVFSHQMALWQYRSQIIPYLGELPVGERASFEQGIRAAYRSSSMLTSLWYESMKAALNPDSVRYIDDLLDRAG